MVKTEYADLIVKKQLPNVETKLQKNEKNVITEKIIELIIS